MRPHAVLLAALTACSTGDLAIPVLAPGHEVDDAARERLEELVEEASASPGEAEPLYALATNYLANGLPELAERTFTLLLDEDGGHAQGWYHRAQALSDLGDIEGACTSMARAAELAPDYAPALSWQGRWMLDLGRDDEAARAFAQAREVDALDAVPLVGLARVELNADRPAEAVDLLLEAVALAPGDGATRHLLASALARAGDEQGAKRERARATAASERDPIPDPWVAMVMTLKRGPRMELATARERLRQHGPEAALPEVQALVAKRPDSVGVLELAAEVYGQLGRADIGLDLIRSASSRKPSDPELRLLISSTLRRMGDRAGAIEAAEDAVQLHPDLGPARHQLGGLQMESGLYPAAVETFEEARRRGYRDPVMLVDLGVLQRMTGREVDAVTTFEQAVELAPDSFQAHLYLARARGEIGSLEAAWEAHARAAELKPGAPELEPVAARLRELAAAEVGG